jgi:hypothetical protein
MIEEGFYLCLVDEFLFKKGKVYTLRKISSARKISSGNVYGNDSFERYELGSGKGFVGWEHSCYYEKKITDGVLVKLTKDDLMIKDIIE